MDEQELTRLVSKYRSTVFRTAFCYLKNHADADDVMQDVFFALYTCETEFEDDEHIKAWLIRVTANKCKNMLRSCRLRLNQPLEAAEEMSYEDSHTPRLLPLLARLKPKYRAVLYLYYYEEIPVKDIAEMLGEKTTAITTRLSRAREQLKAILEKEGYNEP